MLENLTPISRQRTCAAQTVLSKLEPADQDILNAALDNADQWPAKSLDRALRERGIILSDGSITHHRRKECVCWRT